MMAIDHDAQREASGLYVVGALGPADRAAFEAHLAACPECKAEVHALREVADALLYAVPQVEPPPGLRDRVLSAVAVPPGAEFGTRPGDPSTAQSGRVSGSRPIASPGVPGDWTGQRAAPRFGSRSGWLAMAALLLLTTGLGVYGAWLRQRVGVLEAQLRDTAIRLDRTEQQLAEATRTAEGAQMRISVLTAPDLNRSNLAGQNPAPRAAGRGFWSGSRGLVFAATELPPLPAGRTYQLWYLTANAPVSAGLFSPDAAGTIAMAFDPPPAGRVPTGLAVSLEPEGGVPAPTSAIYLAGTTQ